MQVHQENVMPIGGRTISMLTSSSKSPASKSGKKRTPLGKSSLGDLNISNQSLPTSPFPTGSVAKKSPKKSSSSKSSKENSPKAIVSRKEDLAAKSPSPKSPTAGKSKSSKKAGPSPSVIVAAAASASATAVAASAPSTPISPPSSVQVPSITSPSSSERRKAHRVRDGLALLQRARAVKEAQRMRKEKQQQAQVQAESQPTSSDRTQSMPFRKQEAPTATLTDGASSTHTTASSASAVSDEAVRFLQRKISQLQHHMRASDGEKTLLRYSIAKLRQERNREAVPMEESQAAVFRAANSSTHQDKPKGAGVTTASDGIDVSAWLLRHIVHRKVMGDLLLGSALQAADGAAREGVETGVVTSAEEAARVISRTLGESDLDLDVEDERAVEATLIDSLLQSMPATPASIHAATSDHRSICFDDSCVDGLSEGEGDDDDGVGGGMGMGMLDRLLVAAGDTENDDKLSECSHIIATGVECEEEEEEVVGEFSGNNGADSAAQPAPQAPAAATAMGVNMSAFLRGDEDDVNNISPWQPARGAAKVVVKTPAVRLGHRAHTSCAATTTTKAATTTSTMAHLLGLGDADQNQSVLSQAAADDYSINRSVALAAAGNDDYAQDIMKYFQYYKEPEEGPGSDDPAAVTSDSEAADVSAYAGAGIVRSNGMDQYDERQRAADEALCLAFEAAENSRNATPYIIRTKERSTPLLNSLMRKSPGSGSRTPKMVSSGVKRTPGSSSSWSVVKQRMELLEGATRLLLLQPSAFAPRSAMKEASQQQQTPSSAAKHCRFATSSPERSVAAPREALATPRTMRSAWKSWATRAALDRAQQAQSAEVDTAARMTAQQQRVDAYRQKIAYRTAAGEAQALLSPATCKSLVDKLKGHNESFQSDVLRYKSNLEKYKETKTASGEVNRIKSYPKNFV